MIDEGRFCDLLDRADEEAYPYNDLIGEQSELKRLLKPRILPGCETIIKN